MTKEMPKFGGGKDRGKPKFEKPVTTKGGDNKPRSSKKFCVSKISKSNAGKKILIYGKTGLGKSTIAAMAPKPVFIGPDKGLEDLDHPLGEGHMFDEVPGIETFADVRDAIKQADNFIEEGGTAVLDTLTYIQGMCADWVVGNVKKEKGGKAKSITDFGWAKGYEHVYNQLRLLQVDLDALLATGRNVIVLSQLAQTKKTDPTYGEYWFAHPDLYDKGNAPVVAQWVAWASYVWKIDWAKVEIDEGIGTSSEQRAIYTKPEYSFEAKSRGSKFKEYPAVTFDEESDDSVWRILFNE